jgi:hypothetical protein
MEKKKIKKEIFWKQSNECFKWKDIKDIKFEDDDEIISTYVEPYYSENESHDGYFMVQISRMVEETDKEYEKRIERTNKHSEELRQRRYESYLKLKKEFEN